MGHSNSQFFWVSALRQYSPGRAFMHLLIQFLNYPYIIQIEYREKSSSLTVWATEVSNLIWSPHFRSSASRYFKGISFGFGVPTSMLLFYQFSGHSMPSKILQEKSFLFGCLINQTIPKKYHLPPTCILYPVHWLNTFPFCITAAAGTELARDFISKL